MWIENTWVFPALEALHVGLPMFASGVDRYRENPAFLVKMVLLLVALVIQPKTRATAILSLAMWTLVVLAARAVIDFDV
jgi:hypothetical protein